MFDTDTSYAFDQFLSTISCDFAEQEDPFLNISRKNRKDRFLTLKINANRCFMWNYFLYCKIKL